MLNFTYSSLINASVETVWTFHERSDILQILTPPWQPVEVVRREGGLDVGSISEFTIYLGILPVKWLARHIECNRYKLFVDIQAEGPMQHWTHRHEFREEDGKTRLTDAIAYEMPLAPVSELLAGWFVEERLRDMFRYRHEVTQRECENRREYR
ncbi:MAG: SRPBCC family protein [Cyanobacteria bacterium SBLK]|nr:SRPBCC family protein [Cyanobacteria bacterium SBLK]